MKPISIIGGGLAGLTLGIALRQKEVPVTIFEAGRYPRHRVCGEFISGHGRDVLQRLGLEAKFFTAGAHEARTAAFFTAQVGGRVTTLPQPALCLTRYAMDVLLAEEFQRRGGTLHQNHRANQQTAEGIVRATGRRTQTAVEGWRWFGLKAHARHVQLAADLEVHLVPHGYVGICRISSGLVNVCGLFRSRAAVPDLARNWPAWLQGEPNSPLRHRLAEAEFLPDSFCSVGGLLLRPQFAAEHAECCIGDSITMTPPLTGNGMSMAFESAELALAPLLSYSLGQKTWVAAAAEIARACDGAFSRRLRWSRWLQGILLHKLAGSPLIWLASRSPSLWRALFTRTRD